MGLFRSTKPSGKIMNTSTPTLGLKHKRRSAVFYRVVIYTIILAYVSLLVLYTQLGYRHCRSAGLADAYMASRGPMIPSDAVLPLENGTLVVTIVSRPWCLGTLNWVVAARRAGLKNVTVINLGPGTQLCDAVHSLNENATCITVTSAVGDATANNNKVGGFGKAADFGDPRFFDLMTVRTAVIYELLSRGQDIMFSDADVVMLKNPLPVLTQRVQERGLDLLAQRDHGKFVDWFFDPICAGFMYFRNTERTLSFWRSVLSFVLQHPSRNDQKAVNMCGRDPMLGLNYDTLDPALFPDGYRFFIQNEGLVPTTSEDEEAEEKEKNVEEQNSRYHYSYGGDVSAGRKPSVDVSQEERSLLVGEKNNAAGNVVRYYRRDLSNKYIVHTNWILSERKISKMMDEGLWFLPPEQAQLCGSPD